MSLGSHSCLHAVMQMMLSVMFLELMWKYLCWYIASSGLIKAQNRKENSQNILNSVINSINVF